MADEPWLRGTIDGVDPLIAPVLRSFEMAIEDTARATEGLSAVEIWLRPGGVAAAGFHLRHIAGSVDRLLTYALGRQLNHAQMTALRGELAAGASREELLQHLRETLDSAASAIRAIDVTTLREPRAVGRKMLPTTVAGLLVHIAEHTQRHVGQAVTTAKLVRAMRGETTST